jgi:muramoyltetrapeptide carboxypeptidase
MAPMKEALIKPGRLTAGATIGVVAPASPFRRKVFDRGMKILQEMGYALKPAEGLFEASGYLAGSDAHRASQLQDMFLDDEVDAVMCARGGFGSLRMLPHIDWGVLKSHPKPFVGFSDITAIHHAFLAKAGMTSFHGPVVCSLPSSDRQTRLALNRALTSNEKISFAVAKPRIIGPGKAQGMLVGGNLTTLCHLVGTPFAADFSGAVLFLEDTGEAAYRIDRMLMHMKLAGCFEQVSGVLLGSFREGVRAAAVDRLVQRLFAENKIPILGGMAVGHGRRNLTLPVGVPVDLDADNGRVTLLECATAD